MDSAKQNYDEDKKYTLRSRKLVFEREMENLRKRMYGEYTHIWPYMTDARGEYSEEKTQELVTRIADAKRYQRMHIWDYDQYADQLPFYRNLLYCVLRIYTSDYTVYAGGSSLGYGRPEDVLFSHILSAFEDSDREPLDGNAVFFMETLYEMLIGKKICLDGLYAEREEQEAGDAPDDLFPEEALAEKYGYDIEEIRSGEESFLAETKQREKAEKEKVRKRFGSREHFCRSLEEIAAYLENASVSSERLHSEMKEFMTEFLFETGLSGFEKEAPYVEVMVQLKKTTRTARRYTEDEK